MAISDEHGFTDYRCPNEHLFGVPWGDEAPRSTVVCPKCGATSFIDFPSHLREENERLRDVNQRLCEYVREAAGDESVLLPTSTLAAVSRETDRLRAIRDAARELADAVKPLLGTMDFYFGPNARVGVARDKVDGFRRIMDAHNRLRAMLTSASDSPAANERATDA